MTEAMRETGWAKINLALHIRKRRPDGYHELETIFAFVDQGDDLVAEISDVDRLSIDGEFGAGLETGADNLVLRALAAMRQAGGPDRVPPLSLRLTKNLPVAAGIGGGSADAAAMARLVRDYFLPEMGQPHLERLIAPLGADVAACVASRTMLGSGVGSELQPAEQVQVSGLPIVLVNPREGVSTGPIFKAWDQIDRGELFLGNDTRAALLAARNDLQRPAMAQCAAISNILVELGGLRPWLARMSGSGATCFAIFDSVADRDAAASSLRARYPHWWQMAGEVR